MRHRFRCKNLIRSVPSQYLYINTLIKLETTLLIYTRVEICVTDVLCGYSTKGVKLEETVFTVASVVEESVICPQQILHLRFLKRSQDQNKNQNQNQIQNQNENENQVVVLWYEVSAWVWEKAVVGLLITYPLNRPSFISVDITRQVLRHSFSIISASAVSAPTSSSAAGGGAGAGAGAGDVAS